MKKKNNKSPIIADVVRYETSPELGLNQTQINERIANKLVNKSVDKNKNTIWHIISKNVFTVFNLIFVVIFLFLMSANAPIMNFTFVLIIVINTFIGIIQEIKAKRTIDQLSLQVKGKIKTIRNGIEELIDPTELLLDDVIKLSSGEEIPADSIILSGEVELNESSITGESIAIKKSIGDTIYSGSFMVSGNCIARVVRIGAENFIEKIACEAKKMSKSKSEIMNSIGRLLKVIGVILIPLGIILYCRLESSYWEGGFFLPAKILA